MPVSPKSRNQVVRSWQEALQLLDRQPAPNTTAVRVLERGGHDSVQVYLYGHHIITFYPDRIRFTDAGWPTNLTKDRLNRFLPVRIYQQDWQWYINNYSRPMPTSDYYSGRIAWTTIDYNGGE